MAVVPICFNGVMYPKGKAAGDKPVPAFFMGNAWIAGLSVGGGPVYPPDQPSPPLIIWGPGDPRPGWWVPGAPGDPNYKPEPLPPEIWGPDDPRPTVPIAEPPWGWGGTPPNEPPTEGKPPPPDGGWGYHPAYGWGYFPGPGEAQPKKK